MTKPTRLYVLRSDGDDGPHYFTGGEGTLMWQRSRKKALRQTYVDTWRTLHNLRTSTGDDEPLFGSATRIVAMVRRKGPDHALEEMRAADAILRADLDALVAGAKAFAVSSLQTDVTPAARLERFNAFCREFGL